MSLTLNKSQIHYSYKPSKKTICLSIYIIISSFYLPIQFTQFFKFSKCSMPLDDIDDNGIQACLGFHLSIHIIFTVDNITTTNARLKKFFYTFSRADLYIFFHRSSKYEK